MVTTQLYIPTSEVCETNMHVNTLKRPSFRTAFSGSLLESQIPERDCESTSSVCTTPGVCDESSSSRSRADTTMYPNEVYVSSPQPCIQQPTLQAFGQASELLGWMPKQAIPYKDSAYMGQPGSAIWPESYGKGILMHQWNGPVQVETLINVPSAQHISGLQIHAPHSVIQDTNPDLYGSSNGISSDAHFTGLNSPLVPFGNTNSALVLYPALSAQNMLVPATQIINTMPPFALSPAPSNSKCHCGMQTTADTIFNQTSMKDFGYQSTKGDELWRREGEDLWVGDCKYEEYQQEGCSNLFVTWNGSHLELVAKFNHLQLNAMIIHRTLDPRVYNVVFKTHTNARKAFSMQKKIKLRMLPPRKSRRNWLRNPSPSFVVKFETKSRIIVRRGKSTCHEIVGTFLMSNFREGKGCMIWADQLKGNRIRVVGCEGRFMYPDEKIKYLKKFPSKGAKPIGWVSYRSKQTKEDFVQRRSGNMVRDYLY